MQQQQQQQQQHQQHQPPRRHAPSDSWMAAALRVAGPLLLLLVAAVLAQSKHVATRPCSSFTELGLPQPEGLAYSHKCRQARSLLDRFLMLWAPVEVAVDCNHGSYTVLVATSLEELSADAQPMWWCGLGHVLSEPNACTFTLSPLADHFFAVKAGEGGLFSLGRRELNCSVKAEAEPPPRRLYWMAFTAAAVLLFFNAGMLADSVYFRISAGGLGFATGVMLVLLILGFKSMPYKRTVITMFTLSTGSLVTVVRWVYGVWLPSMRTLASSPIVVGYLAVVGLLGAAYTYLRDDPTDVKFTTICGNALRGIALLCVWASLADWNVAWVAVALLALSGPIFALLRLVLLVLRWLTTKLAALARRELARRRAFPAFAGQRQAPHGRRAVGLDGVSLVCSEDNYQEEADLDYDEDEYEDEEEEGEEEEELATEDEEGEEQGRRFEGRAAAAPPAAADREWSWASSRPGAAQTAAAAAAPSPVAPAAGGRRAGPLAAPQAAAAAAAAAAASPGQQQAARVLAHTVPPPLSPAAQQHLRLRGLLQQQQPGRTAGAVWSPPRQVLDVTQRTTPQQPAITATGSGGKWQAREALDISTRRTPPQQQQQQPQRPTPQHGTPRPSPAAAAADAGAGAAGSRRPTASPLASPAKVRNPETGRDISVGGPKYNELISRGYVVDALHNTLVAPAGGAAAAAASGGGGALPRASPASNLRQRAHSGRQQDL